MLEATEGRRGSLGWNALAELAGCVYCGGIADTVDHVLPRSFRSALGAAESVRLRMELGLPDTLPACRSCNSLAGDHVFPTIREKREYVQSKLKRRIRAHASWTEAELRELGYALQSGVRRALADQIELMQRVDWPGAECELRIDGPVAGERYCPECHRVVQNKRPNALFCSRRCATARNRRRGLAKQPIRTCLHCGKDYLGMGQTYCSHACATRHHVARRREIEGTRGEP